MALATSLYIDNGLIKLNFFFYSDTFSPLSMEQRVLSQFSVIIIALCSNDCNLY